MCTNLTLYFCVSVFLPFGTFLLSARPSLIFSLRDMVVFFQVSRCLQNSFFCVHADHYWRCRLCIYNINFPLYFFLLSVDRQLLCLHHCSPSWALPYYFNLFPSNVCLVLFFYGPIQFASLSLWLWDSKFLLLEYLNSAGDVKGLHRMYDLDKQGIRDCSAKKGKIKMLASVLSTGLLAFWHLEVFIERTKHMTVSSM